MVALIEKPTIVESVGNKPKAIEEYVGCVNSGHKGVSIARMKSPCGVGGARSAAGVRGNYGRPGLFFF